MEAVPGIVYLLGILVATIVIRSRAGVGQGPIKILGSDGFGLGWFLTALSASLFWPITLGLWLARGRPGPRVVFNEKAAERRRRSVHP
ncbi:hypothetical protein ACQP0I_26035 [Micromonospora carbonacea]|uniref:hypothetical protein n=1 Tax=Micromonospora carbonacea TaxID=47853 RepID=UPI003D956C68